MDAETLDQILDTLPQLRIAVVGDLFLDKYFDLDASLTEVSVETGLDAYQVTRIRCYPGAAGTVLNNLRALCVGSLQAISVRGNDGEGYDLQNALDAIAVDSEHVLIREDRVTPTYSKPMLMTADGTVRELNRLDIRNRTPQPNDVSAQVIEALEKVAPHVDALIVADQVPERNLGVVTDSVRDWLIARASSGAGPLIFVDSRTHIAEFPYCVTKPNLSELLQAVGYSEEGATPETVGNAIAHFASKNGQAPVYVTRGPRGIVYRHGDAVQEIPGVPVTGPIDIVGAGDSTTAGIVSALCAGATPRDAAALGCLVASITIQQLGVTGTATPDQVRERFQACLNGGQPIPPR